LTWTRAAAVIETAVADPCSYLSHQPSVRGTQRRRDTPSPHPSPDRGHAQSRQRPQVPRSEPCCFSEIVQQDTSSSHHNLDYNFLLHLVTIIIIITYFDYPTFYLTLNIRRDIYIFRVVLFLLLVP
jgi:hypothetical protein